MQDRNGQQQGESQPRRGDAGGELHDGWSIGIYTGHSPLELSAPVEVRNPVLSRCDITDVPTDFVADPFMVEEDGMWYMFFELLATETQRGVIAMASSPDAYQWQYREVVLEEPYHLSYPYVFKWQGTYYMIPETLTPNGIRLYQAQDFPSGWSCVATLIEGRCADPSIFHCDGTWWLMACTPPGSNETLRLYYADELLGPWQEHPQSPIITGDPHIARPAGRVTRWGDQWLRFTQDCYPYYGIQVRAFQITELTRTRYREEMARDEPVLASDHGSWRVTRMHHVDPHRLPSGQWIACVDGRPKKMAAP